jgi:hypothetical protein
MTPDYLKAIADEKREIVALRQELCDINGSLLDRSPGAISRVAIVNDLIKLCDAKVDLAEAEMKLFLDAQKSVK